MIKSIAYGSEGKKFFVQTCCGEQHLGQKCDCKSFGEKFTEEEAKKLAKQKSKELNVSIEIW